MLAELADVVRLVAVPAFAYAAYHDHHTRHVPNKIWGVLLVVALVALVGDAAAFAAAGELPTAFLAGIGLSLLVLPLAFGLWYAGLMGGADAKAIMAMALVFPTTPEYAIGGATFPLGPTPGPFVGVVFVNALVVGVAYLASLAVRNLLSGHLGIEMLYATPVSSDAVGDRFGIVVPPDQRSALTDYLGTGGVDAEVLRDYREWRGLEPGDDWMAAHSRRGGDRWQAQAFVGQAGLLHGTTPAELRDALDYLAAEERVWFSPAVPYAVPLFVGLVLALTVGLVPALAF